MPYLGLLLALIVGTAISSAALQKGQKLKRCASSAASAASSVLVVLVHIVLLVLCDGATTAMSMSYYCHDYGCDDAVPMTRVRHADAMMCPSG